MYILISYFPNYVFYTRDKIISDDMDLLVIISVNLGYKDYQ